jgi:hypothetical protein
VEDGDDELQPKKTKHVTARNSVPSEREKVIG